MRNSFINSGGIDRRLVLAAGAVLPLACVKAVAAPAASFSPEQFGAKGDGSTDDTAAFQKLSAAVTERGGGTVTLRPRATYRLGRQVRGGASDPAFIMQTMFVVSGVNGLTIEGNGAILKLNDGLHYGSFSPGSGAVYKPTRKGKFTNPRYGAAIGGLIEVTKSRGVRIRNLTLDGNAGRLIVGGRHGDVGIQLHADGLRLLDVADVAVENVTARNNGLDGIYLRGRTRGGPATGADSLSFRNVRCIGNGRQGVSVIGGSGIRFANCLFANTGQGALSSAPSAGVDIEPNGKDWASDLAFDGCEFRNNRGVGLLTGGGAARGIAVRGCTFWQGFEKGAGGRGSGDAFWLTRSGVMIDGCTVHGNVTNLAKDAIVRRTSFDDAVLPGVGRSAQRRRYLLAGVSGTFQDCSFTVSAAGAHALAHVTDNATFRRCRFRFAGSALPSDVAAAFFGAVTLDDVSFTEDLRQPAAGGNYIAVDKSIVLRGDVTVSGPHIRWGGTKGRVGNVAAR